MAGSDREHPGRLVRTATAGRAVETALALSGAASTAVLLVAFSISDTGGKGISPDQSADVVVDRLAEYTGQARTGAALCLVGLALQLVFWGQLWSWLRPASERLAVVALCGGMTLSTVLVVEALTGFAAAVAGENGAGEAARTLTVLGWESARVVAPGGCVLVAASTAAGLRHRLFPRWFAWTSAFLTAVTVLSLVPIGPAGLLATVSLVWVLLASVVLSFRRRSGAEGPAA